MLSEFIIEVEIMRRIVLAIVGALLLTGVASCSKTDESVKPGTRIEGRTGYRETICDIAPNESTSRSILSVMRDDDLFYVVVRDFGEDRSDQDGTYLYKVSEDGEIIDSRSIEQTGDIFVMIEDGIACVKSGSTSVISLDDGSELYSFESDPSPIAASSYKDGFVVGYRDHVIWYDKNGDELSTIVNSDFGWFSEYCDMIYEYEDHTYIIACPDIGYSYYEVNLDDGTCELVNDSTELGIEPADCCGGYVFDRYCEYKIDPVSGSRTILCEWNNTNVRPGGASCAGYRYYYVFDDDLFARTYVNPDGYACIQFYEYDEGIDYTDIDTITVGGIALYEDYPIQYAAYKFNAEHDDCRIVIQEFENEGYTDEYVIERNARLISEFSSGNSPDIFYGNYFDYDYFGRNGMAVDLLPLIEASDAINKDDFEPSVWDALNRDGHCYHLITSFYFNGYWGKASNMADYTNMTYDVMYSLDNPSGRAFATRYSSQFAGDILSYPFDSFVDSEGMLTVSEEQIEDVVRVCIEFGLPSTSGYDMLGEEGFNHLRSDEYLMTNYPVTGLKWYYDSVRDAGDNLCFIGSPSVYGSSHGVQPFGSIAVSSSATDPDMCLEFIACLYGADVQRYMLTNGYASVIRQFNDELYEYASDPEADPDIEKIYGSLLSDCDPIPEDVIEAYRQAIDSIDTIQVYDPTVYVMINEELETYDLQGKPIEDIADVLYSKLSLYASEHYS